MERTTEKGAAAPGAYPIRQFAEDVKKKFEARYGDGFQVSVQEVRKNNGVRLTGLTVMEKGQQGKAEPVFYLEGFYSACLDGEKLEELFPEMARLYEKHRERIDFDAGSLYTFDGVEGRICHALVNAGMNREMLEKVPHRPFLDLAVIYYIPLPDVDGQAASITVHNGMLQLWGVDEEALYHAAQVNTPRFMDYQVQPVMEALGILCGEGTEKLGIRPKREDLDGIYVASGRSMPRGASVMLQDGLLREFARKTGGSFYILPSSIHELLFIPALGEGDGARLGRMVRDVNEEVLAKEDILSCHAYLYQAGTGRIGITG